MVTCPATRLIGHNRCGHTSGADNWKFQALCRRMMAMKRGPIGVWFSVAIAVLVLSFWLGSMLGSSVAHYWYGHHQQEQGTLIGPEQIRVESELAELSAVQTLRLYASVASQEGQPGDKDLLNEIEGLENLKSVARTRQKSNPSLTSNSGSQTCMLRCQNNKITMNRWRSNICSQHRFFSNP